MNTVSVEDLPYGLFIGKGQRFADLQLANNHLSKEELQLRLDRAVEAKLVEKNHQVDDIYYFKADIKK